MFLVFVHVLSAVVVRQMVCESADIEDGFRDLIAREFGKLKRIYQELKVYSRLCENNKGKEG